jgi:hypothetical protein
MAVDVCVWGGLAPRTGLFTPEAEKESRARDVDNSPVAFTRCRLRNEVAGCLV